MFTFSVIGGGMRTKKEVVSWLMPERPSTLPDQLPLTERPSAEQSQLSNREHGRNQTPVDGTTAYVSRHFRQLTPEQRGVLVETVHTAARDYCREWTPEQLLLGFKPKAFFEALERISQSPPSPRNLPAPIEALKLVNLFGTRWHIWFEKNGDQMLPLRLAPAPALRDLGNYLLRHIKADVDHLGTIAGNWSNIEPAQRKMAPKELAPRLEAQQSLPDHRHLPFAIEYLKWRNLLGSSSSSYRKLEATFLESQSVPSPFPLAARWQVGGLTGRFLPRSDVRGMFLGQYTDCCQHPEGTGKTCATYGQKSINSGFFVVEDRKGNVVAQSWAWISKGGGLCFDSIEGKGFTWDTPQRRNAIRVYQKAAADLSNRFHRVTVGKSAFDFRNLLPDSKTELNPPQSYRGYRDSDGRQWLLAENESTPNTRPDRAALRLYIGSINGAIRELQESRIALLNAYDIATLPACAKRLQQLCEAKCEFEYSTKDASERLRQQQEAATSERSRAEMIAMNEFMRAHDPLAHQREETHQRLMSEFSKRAEKMRAENATGHQLDDAYNEMQKERDAASKKFHDDLRPFSLRLENQRMVASVKYFEKINELTRWYEQEIEPHQQKLKAQEEAIAAEHRAATQAHRRALRRDLKAAREKFLAAKATAGKQYEESVREP